MSADPPGEPDRPGTSPPAAGPVAPRERRFPEKLDDLQAGHPFPYNLAVGILVGLLAVLIGFAWIVVPIYALSYAALRTYLWGEGRILRRQYEVRKVRAAEAQAARRRRSR